MDVFDRLAPYIQDFIYREHWVELREVQVAACDIIFNSDRNLLLATGTASGKTEAAFLPALTRLYEEPSSSVGILYISPLKALINDQFYRLNYLLKEGDVPVCKWHGDVSQSLKNRLLKNPQGVLQITPESLESLLINKHNFCMDLFKDLRFIIIDEVHYFMGNSRGIQLLCQLERIQRLTGVIPRRIGLSATLGDYCIAEEWLNSGTNRNCTTPVVNAPKRKIGIAMELFVANRDETDDLSDCEDRELFKYLYKHTLNKKSIIFANARSTVEFTIANIKKIAELNHSKDVYQVNHGNIAAILREETEKEMKNSDEPIVTGATVTLELGVDIGTLERIVQIGSPFSVSSFTQRLGRCGRRGQNAELIFTFIEDKDNGSDTFAEINWELLRGIAILQLYLDERWIEPIEPSRYPYALLYHQTMAFLAARGETSPAVLAQNMLLLSSFKNISQNDYKKLIIHLISIGQLQKTERGGLIVGGKGERVVNHYEFYSVFESPAEYLVRCENRVIGTIQKPVPRGNHFALAGHAWECVDMDKKSRTVFVKPVKGISKISWIGTSGSELHTRIIQKMREVLITDENYAYLSENCIEKLNSMRKFSRQSRLVDELVAPLSKSRYAIFPWVGTRQKCALYFALLNKGFNVQDRDYYLIVETKEEKDVLEKKIYEIVENPPDKHIFHLPENIQIPFKYNNFIPLELLRKQFVEDFIDLDGMIKDIKQQDKREY